MASSAAGSSAAGASLPAVSLLAAEQAAAWQYTYTPDGQYQIDASEIGCAGPARAPH